MKLSELQQLAEEIEQLAKRSGGHYCIVLPMPRGGFHFIYDASPVELVGWSQSLITTAHEKLRAIVADAGVE